MKKLMILIALLMCLTMLLYGCGDASGTKKSSKDASSEDYDEDETENEDEDEAKSEDEVADNDDEAADNDDETVNSSDESDDDEDILKTGKFESISDMSEYFNSLYKTNEEAINNYEGLETLDIVTAGSCFIIGIQYDLLNLYNENGRYEGELFLAGHPGYVDKSGSNLTFGFEDVLEEDGWGPSEKAGDKEVESGNCDLDKGYYFSERYREREGARILKTVSEIQKQSDGSMCIMRVFGDTLDFRGNERLNTDYLFMRLNNGSMEYVMAKTEEGADYEFIRLEDNMTKKRAIELLTAAGATIVHSGGVKNGVFSLD